MNHINIVAASVTHIHRNKHLKRNLYICTTVNNTGNKLNNRKLNKKLFLMAQNLIPARSLKFLFCRMEGTVTKQTFSASNTDSSPMAVQLLLTDVNMCENTN
jgi:hypothetical protein